MGLFLKKDEDTMNNEITEYRIDGAKLIKNARKAKDYEILNEFNENVTDEEMLALAKRWIIKRKGFAFSCVSNKRIEYGDIVKTTEYPE